MFAVFQIQFLFLQSDARKAVERTARYSNSGLLNPVLYHQPPENTKRHLFLGNASGDNSKPEFEESLLDIRTQMHKLVDNSTEKTQPQNSFIIAELKRVLRRKWDAERKRRIEAAQFSQNSGEVLHSHRYWYMELAFMCVDSINVMTDVNGVTYLRNSKMMSGVSLDLDGQWRVTQL